jgi:hypothetical protein
VLAVQLARFKQSRTIEAKGEKQVYKEEAWAYASFYSLAYNHFIHPLEEKCLQKAYLLE